MTSTSLIDQSVDDKDATQLGVSEAEESMASWRIDRTRSQANEFIPTYLKERPQL